MILRRFMKHVSDQNWFAVGLDVLVVITGIFLGMQVTDWNEERKERRQDAESLALFINELEPMIEAVESDHKAGIEQLTLVWNAINFSHSCETNAVERRAIRQAVVYTTFRRSFEFRSSGLDAISDSAALARLARPAFSEAIESLKSHLEWFRSFQDQTMPGHSRAHDHLISHLTRIGPLDFDQTGSVPTIVDPIDAFELLPADQLCQDDHFRSDLFALSKALEGSALAHDRLLAFLRRMQDAAVELKQEIAA